MIVMVANVTKFTDRFIQLLQPLKPVKYFISLVILNFSIGGLGLRWVGGETLLLVESSHVAHITIN